jgi:hypothetical protein
MSKFTGCDAKSCAECAEVTARTHRELLPRGASASDVFLLSLNLLELRHPGQHRYYYARCADRIIEQMAFPSGIKFN